MRSTLLIVGSIVLAGLAWGAYGPMLNLGKGAMANAPDQLANLRPFTCVGIAYLAIAVVVPGVLLATRGERGQWSMHGGLYCLLAGVLGALGALGVLVALSYGGRPGVVMPLVFGGAPVVNALVTIYWAKRARELGPIFLAGLLILLLGAVTVLVAAPRPERAEAEPQAPAAQAEETQPAEAEANTEALPETPKEDSKPGAFLSFFMKLAAIAVAIACWGLFGPVLYKGQDQMQGSRLRPLIPVGLAYFVVAVVVPLLLLTASPEASSFTFSGTMWSLGAGTASAVAALAIILAFAFGGTPVYVMPLVFGAAPVIHALLTTLGHGLWHESGGMLPAGLILVLAGAALVLFAAPKHEPEPEPAKPKPEEPKPEPPRKETAEEYAERKEAEDRQQETEAEARTDEGQSPEENQKEE